MIDRYQNLLDSLGRPNPSSPLAPEQLQAFVGRLPDAFVGFIRAHGAGMWKEGRFQFAIPQQFAKLSDRLFVNDHQLLPSETHVVGYSAFGDLLVWNEKYQCIRVSLPRLEVRIPSIEEPDSKIYHDLSTPLFLLEMRKNAFDFVEDTQEEDYLFNRARAKLGPLQLGECYGFVPALGLGGKALLGNLQRLDALVHFMLLAGLGRLRLVEDPVPPGLPKYIRSIGG